jgi:hypothetical protein
MIKGNCNNLIFLNSKEKTTLEEIAALAGNRNNEEPLISMAALQRLNKEKGEAFILHDRQYPFIAELKDIDLYPDSKAVDQNIYPVSTAKIRTVFDIMKFIKGHSRKFLSRLFKGKRPVEDVQTNGNSRDYNDVIIEPVFLPRKDE